MDKLKEGNHPQSHDKEITIIDGLDCFSSLPLFVVVLFLVFDNKESGVLL